MVKHIEALLTHILAYSSLCVTLAYSQPTHFPSHGILRTGGIFKIFQNVEKPYSELCHSHKSLFRHYSRIFRTLWNNWIYRKQAYSESLNIQNPSIIACRRNAYSNPCHILKNRETLCNHGNLKPSHIDNPGIFTSLK